MPSSACGNGGERDTGPCRQLPGVRPRPAPNQGCCRFFFFNDTATTEIYTLSLHDALPIWCVCAAAHPRFFGRVGLALLVGGVTVFGVLMAGGVFGLTHVGTDLWGGLPLTLLLAVVAVLLGVPLGIALALARRSKLPVVAWLATGYIELVRGLPLITLLFFGAFVLPLILPPQWRMDPMLRIGICLTMFSAAYLAEGFRGGLQA